MSDNALFDDALQLALKLSPKERIQLIERVALSLERDIDAQPTSTEQPAEHWGKNLNALVDRLDMSEWQAPEFADPVEWLRQQREQEVRQRLGDWGSEK